uniref:Glycosyltransferase n=1 Tax=viral metagenome TaxID=1070528 RepID=A0A6C0AJ18_9ZZZZ
MNHPHVINLDKRTDRWANLEKEWKGAFKLTRVPAVEASPGWVGCALSHIKIIEDAKARGDPYVLVWEDDCIPRNRHPRAIKELWDEVSYKLSLYPDQWDIVLGATSAAYNSATYNPTLSTHHVQVYNLPHGFTTHWVLYNSRIYDRMISWKEVQEPQIDVYLFKNFRVKVIVPFVAEQAPGFSDIESHVADYTNMFNRTEEHISHLRQCLTTTINNSPPVRTPSFMNR